MWALRSRLPFPKILMRYPSLEIFDNVMRVSSPTPTPVEIMSLMAGVVVLDVA